MTVATHTQLDYYNYDKIMSYNATFNFLCGARGLGKTFGAQLKVIAWAIKDGQQFIYLRRFKDELKSTRNTFFDAVSPMFPDWDFRVNGDQAEMSPTAMRDEKKRPWQVIGFFVALSQGQSKKGTPYPKVRTIIYDEFIIEKGLTHYLPNEAATFENFYMTVDRWQDRTKVFFLANAISVSNPYFLHYLIRPDQTQEFYAMRKLDDGTHFIVCHFADSSKFKEGAYKTKFGQFIRGTAQAEFALDNKFADNHDKLVAGKPPQAQYRYTLETEQGTFSVWIDWEGAPDWYLQEKRPGLETIYTVIPNRMDTDRALLKYNDGLLQYLRAAFSSGNAYFDSQQTRNAFIEIYRR